MKPYINSLKLTKSGLVQIPGTEKHCLYFFTEGSETYVWQQVQGIHIEQNIMRNKKNKYEQFKSQLDDPRSDLYWQQYLKVCKYAWTRAIVQDRRIKRWFLSKLKDVSYAKGYADAQTISETKSTGVQTIETAEKLTQTKYMSSTKPASWKNAQSTTGRVQSNSALLAPVHVPAKISFTYAAK